MALCSFWDLQKLEESEELLKLEGGQKIFIFRAGGRLLYEEEVRKFLFSGMGGWTYEGGIFMGEVYTPLHTMATYICVANCFYIAL